MQCSVGESQYRIALQLLTAETQYNTIAALGNSDTMVVWRNPSMTAAWRNLNTKAACRNVILMAT